MLGFTLLAGKHMDGSVVDFYQNIEITDGLLLHVESFQLLEYQMYQRGETNIHPC